MIVLTGSTPVLPEAFQKSLRTGGRLFAVVGDVPVMQAMTRQLRDTGKEGTAGAYNTVGLFETCITPLRNAQAAGEIYFLIFPRQLHAWQLWTAIKCADATSVCRWRISSDTSGHLEIKVRIPQYICALLIAVRFCILRCMLPI